MSTSRKHAIRPLGDDDARAEALAEVLRAIAHPLRLRLVAVLAEASNEPVGALAERLGAPQAMVSQQLGILRMHRLVAFERRDGKVFYRLAEPQLRDLLACLTRCRQDG
jgi:DNA-binding transcriptional ArsR family regulator